MRLSEELQRMGKRIDLAQWRLSTLGESFSTPGTRDNVIATAVRQWQSNKDNPHLLGATAAGFVDVHLREEALSTLSKEERTALEEVTQ